MYVVSKALFVAWKQNNYMIDSINGQSFESFSHQELSDLVVYSIGTTCGVLNTRMEDDYLIERYRRDVKHYRRWANFFAVILLIQAILHMISLAL